MATNDKKKALKDILSELDKGSAPKERVSEKTFVEKKESDDITGLEQKIPIVSGGIINFEDDPESMEVEVPVPDGFSVKEDTGEFEIINTDSGVRINEIKPKEAPKEIPREIPKEMPKEEIKRTAEPSRSNRSDSQHLNTVELLEQKLLLIEEENRKQLATLSSQKAEIDEYRERIGKLDAENKKFRAELSSAEGNVRLDLEAQLNKAAVIEEKYRTLSQHHEEVKAKVRKDIQKIRMREKELANKLEMMKNDSETLLAAKDHKILQLKQHIDNLEFEIESLKEKVTSFQELARENEEKAERVIKALRLSTSLLETGSKKE